MGFMVPARIYGFLRDEVLPEMEDEAEKTSKPEETR
jgi:hypothetical protein